MKKPNSAFTLIELLVTIVIIGILTTLIAPQAGRLAEKARSAKCANNLRSIGSSVMLYVQDNNNHYPAIESLPSEPVYENPVNGVVPKPMFETLSPYGVTKETLKCPDDVTGPNYFAKEGSSYQWRNLVDDELTGGIKFYSPRGVRTPNSAWIVMATDYEAVHNGRGNRLYGDGHVRSY